jgi:hypothetical protein
MPQIAYFAAITTSLYPISHACCNNKTIEDKKAAVLSFYHTGGLSSAIWQNI